MDGYVKIGVQLDDLQFEKEIKEIDKFLDKKKKLEIEVSEEGQAQVKIAEYEREIVSLERAIDSLILTREKIAASAKENLGISQGLEEIHPEYAKAGEELYNIDLKIRAILDKQDLEKQKLEEKNQELVRTNEYLGIAEAKLEQARIKTDEIKFEKLSKDIKETNDGLKNVSAGIGGIVKKVAKWGMAVFGLRTAYNTIRKIVSTLSSENAQIGADLSNITSSFARTFEPALQWLIDKVYQLMGMLNSITSTFFGFALFTNKASKNTDKIASGMGGAAKSAEKIKKSLAGFDEMNILSDDSTSSGGGGGGGITPEIEPRKITNQFEGVFKSLKEKLKAIWELGPVQDFVNNIGKIFAARFKYIKIIGGTIWDNVKESWAEAEPFLVEGMFNIVEYWLNVVQDLADVSEEWLPKIGKTVSDFIDSISDTFRPLTTFMSQIWRDVTKIILDVWNEHGKPILDGFMEFIDNTVKIFKKIWTSIINPIIEPAIKFLKRMWDDHIKEIVEIIFNFIGKVIKAGLDFYNKFISPIVGWLLDKLKPIFTVVFKEVFKIVGDVFDSIFRTIKGVLKNISGAFDGFIMLIKGIFKGDWKMIWEGAVKVFKNIFSGIVNIAKLPINGMIDLINSFIRRLSYIKIPNWVPGVGGMGINIPTIPKLATGGIINYPNHGVVLGRAIGGESGAEGVIPLTDNQAMARLGEAIGRYIVVNANITTSLNGRTINRELRKIQNEENFALNGGL